MKKFLTLVVTMAAFLSTMYDCSGQAGLSETPESNKCEGTNKSAIIKLTDKPNATDKSDVKNETNSTEYMIAENTDSQLNPYKQPIEEFIMEIEENFSIKDDEKYRAEETEEEILTPETAIHQNEETFKIENAVPGTTPHSTILEGIAKWAKNEKSLEIDRNSKDVNAIFESNEVKTYIKDYAFFSLTDGTIIGYLYYEKAESTSTTCDFASQHVADVAKKMGKNSYVNPETNSAFFIISDNIESFIGYYMCCKEGNMPS